MLNILRNIFRFCGWVIVFSMALHMSILGCLAGYMPLWLFSCMLFAISLPVSYYLTVEGNKPPDKWDWK